MSKFLIEQAATASFEPLLLTVEQTQKTTGESRSQVYNRIGRGEYEAVKSGSRTLITFASIKRRVASLPRANVKAPSPRPRRIEPTKSEIS
jgi:hypothetical protein